MTVSATLREIAAELRQHPEHWTQGEWARDAGGRCVSYPYMTPVCWCAFGLCSREEIVSKAMPILSELVRERNYGSVPEWNDAPGRTAADVADLFERAAAKAEA